MSGRDVYSTGYSKLQRPTKSGVIANGWPPYNTDEGKHVGKESSYIFSIPNAKTTNGYSSLGICDKSILKRAQIVKLENIEIPICRDISLASISGSWFVHILVQ